MSESTSDSREVREDAGERKAWRSVTNAWGFKGAGETSRSSDEDGLEGGKDCGVSRP